MGGRPAITIASFRNAVVGRLFFQIVTQNEENPPMAKSVVHAAQAGSVEATVYENHNSSPAGYVVSLGTRGGTKAFFLPAELDAICRVLEECKQAIVKHRGEGACGTNDVSSFDTQEAGQSV
jgi:hypothetical protein